MSQSNIPIDPNLFAALAEIYERIKPLVSDEFGDIYLDGKLSVRHKNDFVVGTFVMEDDWWQFYPEDGA